MGYSNERKRAVLAKLTPPQNRSVKEVAAEEGIADVTLYAWRREARQKGELLPAAGSASATWSSRDKFATVMATAALSAEQQAEYCRKHGLYVEELAEWRRACEEANGWAAERNMQQKDVDRATKQQIRELERDLNRKNRALAETAALLTLSKKARAIWGDSEDE